MGHALGDSSTYMRFYMTDFLEVDFQEIVFGSEPQRVLIQLMGRLLRHGDAPKSLTEQQKAEINDDRKLTNLRRKRDRILTRIRKLGWTLKTATNTKLGRHLLKRHNTHNRQVESLRKTLHDRRLARAIQEFHDSIHGEEIDRQLNGIRPSEYLAPPTVRYQLPERARIAKQFSEVVNVSNRGELHQLRMSLVRQLALLCKQRERPHRHREKSGYKPALPSYQPAPSTVSARAVGSRSSSAATAPTITMDATTTVGTLLVCPFCGCEDGADSLANHIRRHLKRLPIPFQCPYEGCSGILGGAEHFADHSKRQHSSLSPVPDLITDDKIDRGSSSLEMQETADEFMSKCISFSPAPSANTNDSDLPPILDLSSSEPGNGDPTKLSLSQHKQPHRTMSF